MAMPTARLKCGLDMPLFGLGTYRLKGDVCARVVKSALELGYTLIDTATVYKNEEAVGRGIEQSGIDRSKIWITTKVSPREWGYTQAQAAIQRSLKALNVSYLDCVLMHWPGRAGIPPEDPANAEARQETWKALEEAYESGIVRAIGVSNFLPRHLQGLGRITPFVNQIEFHVWLRQPDVVQYCRDHGILVQGYSTLGEGALLHQYPELDGIASKHGVSKAVILLAWSLAHGVGVIPKTQSPERLLENMKALQVKLDSEDMQILDNPGTERRFCWDPHTVA